MQTNITTRVDMTTMTALDAFILACKRSKAAVTNAALIEYMRRNRHVYCKQNKGDCTTCSLANQKRDCMNLPIGI